MDVYALAHVGGTLSSDASASVSANPFPASRFAIRTFPSDAARFNAALVSLGAASGWRPRKCAAAPAATPAAIEDPLISAYKASVSSSSSPFEVLSVLSVVKRTTECALRTRTPGANASRHGPRFDPCAYATVRRVAGAHGEDVAAARGRRVAGGSGGVVPAGGDDEDAVLFY
jgi:hypothetical protein